MNDEYRAAVLLASRNFPEKRVRLAMPAHHRIAAVANDPDSRFVRYLIEGPGMPLVVPGDPELPDVALIMSMTYDPDTHEVKLFGHWNSTDNPRWEVGTWPGLEAYAKAMRDMDNGA